MTKKQITRENFAGSVFMAEATDEFQNYFRLSSFQDMSDKLGGLRRLVSTMKRKFIVTKYIAHHSR